MRNMKTQTLPLAPVEFDRIQTVELLKRITGTEYHMPAKGRQLIVALPTRQDSPIRSLIVTRTKKVDPASQRTIFQTEFRGHYVL